MIGGVNSVAWKLSQVYQANNVKLTEALSRIASGKKIANPGDGFAQYNRAQSKQTEVDQFEIVKENLTEAKAVADVAVEAGDSIYEDLTRMKELAQLYIDNTGTDDRAAYTAEFNALKSSINTTIANSKYDGTRLVAAGTASSVETDPDSSGTFDIYFVAGDIVSVSALSISNGTAAVQTQLNTATTYLVKAESFSDQATRQINMTDTIIQSRNSVISQITDVDDVEATAKATELGIRQQATVAMLAQANLLQSGVGRLYGDGSISFGG